MANLRKLAAGNWKMNGTAAYTAELDAISASLAQPGCDVLICPPFTLVHQMAQHAVGTAIAIGGQDCHVAASGAHTGDVSAEMLAEAGAQYVLVGHSERRADHGETDDTVSAKARAAWRAGLIAVICVGETLAEREAGKTLDVIGGQLAGSVPAGAKAANTVVAYEPVWAIGTGKVATLDQIAEVHDIMRKTLSDRFGAEADGMRLLYGGSVKPDNADEIFGVSNVDGALVGGASLKGVEFGRIIEALAASG